MIPEELIVLIVSVLGSGLCGFVLKWLTGRSYRVRLEAERGEIMGRAIGYSLRAEEAEKRERERVNELLAFKTAQAVGDNRPLMSSMIKRLGEQREHEEGRKAKILTKDLGPQEAVPMTMGGTIGDSMPMPSPMPEVGPAAKKDTLGHLGRGLLGV